MEYIAAAVVVGVAVLLIRRSSKAKGDLSKSDKGNTKES